MPCDHHPAPRPELRVWGLLQHLRTSSAKDQPAALTEGLQWHQTNQQGDNMERRGLPPDMGRGFPDLEAALLELREALMCFSLALQDWQFDNDTEQREMAGQTTDSLLRQIRVNGYPGR